VLLFLGGLYPASKKFCWLAALAIIIPPTCESESAPLAVLYHMQLVHFELIDERRSMSVAFQAEDCEEQMSTGSVKFESNFMPPAEQLIADPVTYNEDPSSDSLTEILQLIDSQGYQQIPANHVIGNLPQSVVNENYSVMSNEMTNIYDSPFYAWDGLGIDATSIPGNDYALDQLLDTTNPDLIYPDMQFAGLGASQNYG
jgi:hypothetical protein